MLGDRQLGRGFGQQPIAQARDRCRRRCHIMPAVPATRAAHSTAVRPADRFVLDLVTGATGRADEDHQKSMPGCFGLAAMIVYLPDFVDATRPPVILTSPKP